MVQTAQLELEAPEPELKLETFDVEASRMPLQVQLKFQEGRLEALKKELKDASDEDKSEIQADIGHAEAQIALIKDRILGEVAMKLE
ncbi:MAG: hypothetical protein JWN26_123 [Candidatus Saccharibacteria bacterium]|jgi:hypothetical protein|nr:hypothetical protein [Candidatus Saccharibacteria bacterium]